MPNDHSVDKLSKCIRECGADEVCVTSCENAFVADGGKVFNPGEEGKVFVDAKGGKVFVTKGGKVF
jgi:hypothetical protein